MKSRPIISALILALMSSSATRADMPQPVLVRAVDGTVPATRTYFIGESASDVDAIDFRLRLLDLGARNVNLFLPDRIIVCDLPDRLETSLELPAGFARATSMEVESQPAFTHRTWSWIVDAYRTVDNPPAMALGSGGAAGFDDVVVTLTPDQVDEIERHVDKSRVLPLLAPGMQMQDLSASSSFLGGSITANFIFPESDGNIEENLETWSDADLSAAEQGAAEAMISWQGFPKMDVGFVFNMERRVATGYEPILHNMNNDRLWMLDALRTLGWGGSGDVMAAVHEYNQAKRAIYKTQWVFTGFIACSRNTPGNKFGNGTADYTAYAFLGGPCLVQPFPSGTDINGVGERLVYSQIVNHEGGHCFWTLDEYPGAPGGCSSASGYLNYGNGNITLVSPGGGELRCNTLQECIMHTAARKNIFPRPWCVWSRGHLGVIDNNSNGLPDIFEAAPTIEFESGTVDTVLTNQYTLRCRVTANAVPNRNPRISPDKRVDYAAPLRRGWLSLGSGSKVPIDPVDGRWDEVVEDIEFHVQLANVGTSAFGVEVENTVGYGVSSGKTIHFVGVNYSRTGVSAQPNRNTVSWEIAGNPFAAKFDVYRLNPGEAMPGTRIRENVLPSGPPKGGFIPFQWDDHGVVAGRDYRYYVEGHFELPFEGGTREYRAPSKVISQTAMIPFSEDMISNIAPNPSRGAITFSVSVPRTYGGPERAPTREATPVDISIFSVNGQLVRNLARGGSLDDVMTLHWDGYDQKNRLAPSGIYFVRATAGSAKGFQKIVLLR